MTTQIKIWECFYHPPKLPLCFSQPKSTPCTNRPHPDSNLLQPDISFVCSSNSCQWNHTVCTLLFTFTFYADIIMTVRFIHVIAGKSSFILYLCSSSLNKCIYPFYWAFGLLPVWGCYEYDITYKFLKFLDGSLLFKFFKILITVDFSIIFV